MCITSGWHWITGMSPSRVGCPCGRAGTFGVVAILSAWVPQWVLFLDGSRISSTQTSLCQKPLQLWFCSSTQHNLINILSLCPTDMLHPYPPLLPSSLYQRKSYLSISPNLYSCFWLKSSSGFRNLKEEQNKTLCHGLQASAGSGPVCLFRLIPHPTLPHVF